MTPQWPPTGGPAAPETPGARASARGQTPVDGRLEHLYEISKLFANFETIDQSFEPALSIVTKTLPLRTAVLIEEEDGQSWMVVWRSEGQSAEQQRAVKKEVEAAYRYLVATGSTEPLDLCELAGKTVLPRLTENVDHLETRFMVIPLVVPNCAPFGILALEGAGTFAERDLRFVNTITNQLAMALDRKRAWQTDIDRRDRAEEGRTHAETASAEAEQERARAEALRVQAAALAADNAKLYLQAQQAVRVREQILAIVSHDLRGPLGTILLTTAVLAKRGVAEERRRGLPLALGRIRRAADRMQRLIEDLLDFASIESGRLAITEDLHDPAGIIDETLTSFESTAQETHLRITAQVQPNLPRVWCDRDRILQVLSNLVSNAAKATADGGQITIGVQKCGSELWFSVADNGQGISKADLQHLFERYWRSEDAMYKGSGLGLAIADGILKAHKGRIWAESDVGQGATLWFALPGIENGPSKLDA